MMAMSHHLVVVLALWMTTSYHEVTTASSSSSAVDTLLTSANSLLAKIIKPPSSSSSSGKSSKPSSSKAKLPTTANNIPFRLEIPVYEQQQQQLASAKAAAWKLHYQQQQQQQSTLPNYWAPHHPQHHSPSYQQQHSSTGTLPALLDYHYQSPVWSAALLGSYANHDHHHQFSGDHLISPPHQWPSSASSSPPSLATSPSYHYPLFMAPSANSPSSSSDTATSSFFFGKSPSLSSSLTDHQLYHRPYTSQEHFSFPPLEEDFKLKPGELPLSLVAAEMLAEAATSSSPSSSSSSQTPELNFFDSQLFDHHSLPSSTSTSSFTNPFADQSSGDPFAETRNFEHFQQQHQNDQNHYFGTGGNKESPSSLNSLLLNEQMPPYYLEDTFNNFASLLQQRPQTMVRPPSPSSSSSQVTTSASGNWPHHSRYEADDRRQQRNHHLYNNGSAIISLRRKASNDTSAEDLHLRKMALMHHAASPVVINCTTTTTTTTTTTRRPSHRHPTFGFDFSEAPFRPILPGSRFSAAGQPPHFEALRRRSGALFRDQKAAAAALPLPPNDRLLAATSIASHTRVKLNDVESGDEDEDSSNHKDSSSGEVEDAGAEQDQSKGGETESALDGESEDSVRSAAEDDGSNGPNHDRERLQYLKDKGYAKHGWKNVYHKEEWGEQKKYHDIWRFKDWKDRFADKSPAASQLRPNIVAAPLNSNLEVPIVNSTNSTVPHNTVRQK